jgi:hypothetical protein
MVRNLKSDFLRIIMRMKPKQSIFIALAVFSCFILAHSLTAEKQTTSQRQDNIRIVRVMTTLKGPDLQKSRERIKALPGVVDVKIDERKKEAVVRFDINKTTLKNLDEPLRKAGFIPWYH